MESDSFRVSKMERNCRFCNIVKKQMSEYGIVDTPFLENKKFFSLVSIGAFICGWTLLISKEHMYNLNNYYDDTDFYDYLLKHINMLRQKLHWEKRMIVFEHGANSCCSLVACDTSHAHLHIVPWDDSILEEIMVEYTWQCIKWRDVTALVRDQEYWLYCENPEAGADADVYIHIIDKPESQYFRRVIAEKIGLVGEYSYKKDLRIEQSMETRSILEG